MTHDPKPAMTMREIRQGIGHKTPPPGIPEPTVLPTRYVVSCLPLGHDSRILYTINVEYRGDGKYALKQGLRYYGTDGTWTYEPSSDEDDAVDSAWLATHRFDHDVALRLARELAPGLTYRGLTVAEAIAGESNA